MSTSREEYEQWRESRRKDPIPLTDWPSFRVSHDGNGPVIEVDRNGGPRDAFYFCDAAMIKLRDVLIEWYGEPE